MVIATFSVGLRQPRNAGSKIHTRVACQARARTRTRIRTLDSDVRIDVVTIFGVEYNEFSWLLVHFPFLAAIICQCWTSTAHKCVWRLGHVVKYTEFSAGGGHFVSWGNGCQGQSEGTLPPHYVTGVGFHGQKQAARAGSGYDIYSFTRRSKLHTWSLEYSIISYHRFPINIVQGYFA